MRVSAVYSALRRIKPREYLASRSEPLFDNLASALGLAEEQAHANRESLVKTAVSQIEVLELCEDELGLTSCNLLSVSLCRRLDHFC